MSWTRSNTSWQNEIRILQKSNIETSHWGVSSLYERALPAVRKKGLVSRLHSKGSCYTLPVKRLRWYDFIFINLFWIGIKHPQQRSRHLFSCPTLWRYMPPPIGRTQPSVS